MATSTTTQTQNPSLGATVISKATQAIILYLRGVQQACRVHTAFILCYRSRSLLIRTGQCFLFNGFIFLGSVIILKSFLIPMLQWILPDTCPHIIYEETFGCRALVNVYSNMRHLLENLIYLLWFFPLYALSVIISIMWYNDIARHGFVAMGTSKPPAAQVIIGQKDGSSVQNRVSDKPTGFGGVLIGIGEQVYSVLLLSLFFLEVNASEYVPYVGKAISFLLLSWMHAYACFEYKWNFSGVTLDRRLDYFESNWAFFAGFGSLYVLPTCFFPRLESSATMATLFPLFVLTATSSDGDTLINFPRKQWLGAGLGRVPIFCAADYLLIKVLSFLSLRSGTKLRRRGSWKST